MRAVESRKAGGQARESAVRTIDFNSDLGESYGLWERGADEVMMRCISSANVACGFHAGDPTIMRKTVEQARDQGISVGAHPGFPDLLGFGRRTLGADAADVHNYVLYQVGALAAFVAWAGLRLHHVKPHGALYMQALDDARIARAVAEAVARFDERLLVYTLDGSELWHASQAVGLRAVPEFFADRPIHKDGSVVMFRWWEQFEATPEVVASRALAVATKSVVTSIEGDPVEVRAATICVHSDTPRADRLAPAVKNALEGSGVKIQAI